MMPLGQEILQPQAMMQQMAQRRQLMQQQAVKTDQLRQSFADEQRMRQLMATVAQQPGTPTAHIQAAGQHALQMGMFGQAEKAFNAAQAMTAQAAKTADMQSIGQVNQAKASLGKLQELGGLANVFGDSPQGWAALKTAYAAAHPNMGPEEQQLLNTPYRKGIVGDLQGSLLTAQQRIMAQIRAKEVNARAANYASQQKFRDFMMGIESGRLKAAQAREARLAKNAGYKGSHAFGIPTSNQTLNATQVIQESAKASGIPVPTGAAMDSLSLTVASEARMIQKQQGLPWDQALQVALNNNASRIKVVSSWGGYKHSTEVTPPANSNLAMSSPELMRHDQSIGNFPQVTSPQEVQDMISKGILKPGDHFINNGKTYQVK